MNALRLHNDLKKRGVRLEADGDDLKVDAPAGALTGEDRGALVQAKPALLAFLTGSRGRREPEDDGRRFRARPSRHPGYTSLYDPVGDEWHDFPTKDCYPSVVALAGRREELAKQHEATELAEKRRREREEERRLGEEKRPG